MFHDSSSLLLVARGYVGECPCCFKLEHRAKNKRGKCATTQTVLCTSKHTVCIRSVQCSVMHWIVA